MCPKENNPKFTGAFGIVAARILGGRLTPNEFDQLAGLERIHPQCQIL